MKASWWIAYAFMVTMLGTTLPTPLYPIYQAQFGLSGLIITLIYATYALGVVGALLTLGSWSDQLGRRPVLLTGVGCSAASAVVFLLAHGLAALFLGRVLSGLSAGMVMSAATVAVIELAPASRRGLATLVATAANMLGLGLGPLLAGLLAQYAPWPLHLVFIVDLVLLIPAARAVWRAPETVDVTRRPVLRVQRLSVPPPVRASFVPAVIAGFAGFAVLGFFTAVAPIIMGGLLHQHSHALIGAIVFALLLASPLGQFGAGGMSVRRALPLGCIILMAGVVLVGIAIALASLGLLVAGAIVSGFGQGLVFRAGVACIAEDSPAHQRAAVTSTYFVILYIAISIPVVGVGAANQWFGMRASGIGFAIAAVLLTLSALLILVWRGRSRQRAA